MKLSDFDFELPEALIATRPARPRSASRMLVAGPATIDDANAYDLPGYLRPGDRLVLNDTKVIPARLMGKRERGKGAAQTCAQISVTLLEPTSDTQWRALLKPLKKVRIGEVIQFVGQLNATLTGKEDGVATLQFNLIGNAFDRALADVGAMPLPPYIAAKRAADALDMDDYQTVWARHSGAVAAPTASLHFDHDLLEKLRVKGITFTHVTLHVGAGTFLPVKVDNIKDHKMHAEWGEVTEQAASEINQTRASGGRIIPVGTTALRLIETAATENGKISPWVGDTDIFISPGYRFRVADALITNFHLPKSTLMMLVSALMGAERIREIYDHAIENKYRFFSYGDASLLLPQAETRQS